MLYNVFLIAQILIALSIIGLVLIQHGKGADAGAAFGGGASGTVFGSRGSGNFLSRATGILAALFFANSLFLAWMTAHPAGSATESIIPAAVSETGDTKPAPAATIPADVPQADSAPEKQSDVPTSDTPADVPSAAAPAKAVESVKKTVEKATDAVTTEANKAVTAIKEAAPTADAEKAKPADVPQ